MPTKTEIRRIRFLQQELRYPGGLPMRGKLLLANTHQDVIAHLECLFHKYCHQKPKFANFEYCGKFCATQAKPQMPANPTVPGGGRGFPLNKGQQASAPILGSIPMPTAGQAISACA